jgi:hypothetical protein
MQSITAVGIWHAKGILHCALPVANWQPYPIQLEQSTPNEAMTAKRPTIIPRYCGRASSALYTGTTDNKTPTARPAITRPAISIPTFCAAVWIVVPMATRGRSECTLGIDAWLVAAQNTYQLRQQQLWSSCVQTLQLTNQRISRQWRFRRYMLKQQHLKSSISVLVWWLEKNFKGRTYLSVLHCRLCC